MVRPEDNTTENTMKPALADDEPSSSAEAVEDENSNGRPDNTEAEAVADNGAPGMEVDETPKSSSESDEIRVREGGAPSRFQDRPESEATAANGRDGSAPSGQPPAFFQGRTGSGPPASRFGSTNFEQPAQPSPWSGPPTTGHVNPFGSAPLINKTPNANTQPAPSNVGAPHQQPELWVETKSATGKVYFYHAITRETTWTKPEGPRVKIMTQTDVEVLTAKNMQQHMQNQQQQQQKTDDKPSADGDKKNDDVESSTAGGKPASSGDDRNAKPDQLVTTQPPSAHLTAATQQKPLLQQAMHTQPPPQQHQHHHAPPHFSGPPPHFNAAGPQYGMPPPGYGGYPQGGGWGMPWQQPPQMAAEQPAKNLIAKPGVIEPQIIARAAEWSEHRAPDGRPYYYHSARGESVWEKPQAFRDLEAARMAAHAGTNALPPVTLPPGPVMTAMQINATPVMAQQMHHQIHQITNAQAAAAAAAAMFDPMAFAVAMKTQDITKLVDESVEAKLEKKRKDELARKKKEDEEKAKQATVKQVDKSRPISSTPIAGTPWCVVWTGDGRVFFYNPSTRTSVWERPEDLLGRADVDKAISTTPEQLPVPSNTKEEKTPGDTAMEVSSSTVESTGGAAASGTVRRHAETDSSGEDADSSAPKKSKLEAPNAVPVTKQPEKNKDIGKEAAIEAEVRAARERALVPLEIRVTSFKEMLKEKDVSAFSTWEKELHKIVFDPRYLLLTSRERKQVFEKYVKDRAEEERREKRNKMRQKRDDFRSLMESSHLHGKSSFSDFAQKNGKDERFKGIEKMRERESLFNEFIVEVRRREKDEKQHKKEQVRKDFLAMLREHSDIDRHSRWSEVKKRLDSDSRYRAVENSLVREDYFVEYGKMLKDEKRKAKEKERERKEKKEREKREKERQREKEKHKERSGGEGKSNGGADKDKEDKGKDKDKSRRGESKEDKHGGEVNKERSGAGGTTDDEKATKEAESGSEAERNDKDDMDQTQQEDGEHIPDSEEDEAERKLEKDRERQQRAEHSIKEREKEVQLQLAGHLRDRDKEREHHKRDEAMRHFGALLADLVRNADLTWKEVKKQLRKDHRWELVEQLDREDRERLFNDHLEQLSKKKRDKFRELLEEVPRLNLSTSFRDVKRLIRDDPRYLKYNSSEKCEREFKDYIKDKTAEAKTAFRELLQECKLITHKSLDTVQENPQHVKEIEEILKNDKRYLVLDHLATERSQMLMTYLEDLHKRGPPPPPTASESTRRK